MKSIKKPVSKKKIDVWHNMYSREDAETHEAILEMVKYNPGLLINVSIELGVISKQGKLLPPYC